MPEPVKEVSTVLELDIPVKPCSSRRVEGVGRGCVDSERSSMLSGIENA